MPRYIWKIAIVTRVLHSGDSEIKGAVLRIKKTNAILKRLVNKLFLVQYTYRDTNQTDRQGKKSKGNKS